MFTPANLRIKKWERSEKKKQKSVTFLDQMCNSKHDTSIFTVTHQRNKADEA